MFVYATNKRDLENSRKKLAKDGHIFRENFKDVDGDPLEQEYRDAKKATSKKEKLVQLVREREGKAMKMNLNSAVKAS